MRRRHAGPRAVTDALASTLERIGGPFDGADREAAFFCWKRRHVVEFDRLRISESNASTVF